MTDAICAECFWMVHIKAPHCKACAVTWHCDTIAALDALEVEGRDIQFRMFELQTRLDAATVLIRQAMEGWHSTHSAYLPAIDTCPHCAPYREWLGNKEDDGAQTN